MIELMAYLDNISPTPLTLRILVVAQDLLARAGLASLLADQPGVAVVGQVDGERLDNDVDVYRPDILVWDAGAAGSAFAMTIPDHMPVVALVADGAVASEARRMGIKGVLPRAASPQLIASAGAAVMQGLVVLDPSFAPVQPSRDGVPESLNAIDLTPRELEVLKHLAQGTSNKVIAYDLDISEHTIKFHVTSIMTKLDARSRTEAVVIATRMGLIPL